MKLIFDAYMLLHTQYSGIPNMAFVFMKELINNNIDCLYSIGYRILDNEEVQYLINEHTGQNVFFDVILANKTVFPKFLSQNDFNERIYFSEHTFSCVKTRGLGKVRVIHDLTPINFPQFHTKAVTEIEGSNLSEDIKEADLVITISEASRTHLCEYFSIPKERIAVCPNGIEWTKEQLYHCNFPIFNAPYVLILGTLEPRKNLNLIFSWLVHHISTILNSELIYVVAGPKGWGEIITKDNIKEIEQLIKSGRLVFTGFVPEELKMSLLAGARYLLYPSICEGFGLPLAEALSVGTPVVTSFGGALPEVCGDSAFYFSPYDERSLDEAIQRLESARAADEYRLKQACIQQAREFTLRRYCKEMLFLLSGLYEQRIKDRSRCR